MFYDERLPIKPLLSASILNLAINARNAMPNGGRKRPVALQRTI
jgi:hypothetical protein